MFMCEAWRSEEESKTCKKEMEIGYERERML
jgi:hypothetical protein